MFEHSNLISLHQLSVQKNGHSLLHNLTVSFGKQECWAITGPIGSGKTTLLQVLAGQLSVQPGMVNRRDKAAFVSFREESGQFSYSSHFYQQRYQATLSDDGPTVREFMQTGHSADDAVLLQRLSLKPLLDLSFLKLSNGQTRKARIGRALLQRPAVLLLDNPFVGLDAAFRAELTIWLGELVRDGLSLILVVEPDELPPFVDYVLELERGRVHWSGPRTAFVPNQLGVAPKPALPVWQTPALPVDFAEAFRLTNVTVRYGERVLLDTINWAVGAGERWALLGPNGAGKSVLLSLLYGDHPQAYANDVQVFGQRRGQRGTGTGQSIWDVKRRIGFVSPELHLYFPQHLTARQVALTGLTDTQQVPNRIASETTADLLSLLIYFGLSGLVDRPFGTLSAGEQRLILLIRALLKNPPVLILDEPFQALDIRSVQLARHLIDSLSGKTILFVSHNQYELPDSISKQVEIDGGALVCKPGG